MTRRHFDACVDVVGTMAGEIAALRADSAHLLRADIYRLLVMMQRSSGATPARETDASAQLAARFARLVAAEAGMGDRVASYAERLQTTSRTLNRCLRSAYGRSAGELIQQHVLLASRRLLLQTDLPASVIAERLDFSDPSYFSRFFQRHMGMTPGAFRRRHESASADADVHCEGARDH